MSEFVSFDPRVEVASEVLLAWIAGTEGKVVPYLEARGIADVQPGQWYGLQTALDGLHDFSQVTSLFNAGMLIPQHAAFPPGIDDIWSAFKLLNEAYHMNHRYGEIGFYKMVQVDDHTIDMICQNPYPCEFDFGLVFCLAHRFAPNDEQVEVIHDKQGSCRKRGGDYCTYRVKF